MQFTTLINAAELAEFKRFRPDNVKILDCRARLGDADYGMRAYATGHLPTAGCLSLDEDLAAPAGASGRHPLPDAVKLAARLAGLGVNAADQIVVYDDAGGAFGHPLKAYNDHPVWAEDPKRRVFKDTVHRTIPYSHSGSLGYAASSAFADFIVVNMVAEAAGGVKTPKEAAADAQKRAERYYRI